jgi:hypothetical protein
MTDIEKEKEELLAKVAQCIDSKESLIFSSYGKGLNGQNGIFISVQGTIAAYIPLIMAVVDNLCERHPMLGTTVELFEYMIEIYPQFKKETGYGDREEAVSSEKKDKHDAG